MSSGRRFELVRELGSGAFGTVYLANMVSGGDFRKRVAIKLLNGQWDASGDAGRRLRDEARLLGLLRHRAIVAVDDLVLLDGKWAVVMEHVPGADLERVLEAAWRMKRNFPAPAAMELISAVAGALDAAWSGAPEGLEPLKVVHRDIKPSNIRLTADGDVKVLDFGIARGNFEGREAKTEQIRYGSLGYMAPERVLGEDEGPEGDIYAVGCVAVELLRGTALGRSALLPEQQQAQVQAALQEITELLGPDSAAVTDLIRDMLAYETADRPSAAKVADRARKLARTLTGQDLPEFMREMLPMVTAILGDASKEIDLALSEQLVSGGRERKDTETLATLVEGSPFDRATSGQPLTGLTGEPSAEPARSRLGVWLGVGLGSVGVLALAVFLFKGPADPPPEADPTPPVPAEIATNPVETAPASAPPEAPPVEAAPAELAPSQAPPIEARAVTPEGLEPIGAGSSATSKTARTARSTPDSSTTSATAPVEAAPEPPATATATLRAVKFAAPSATSVSARCGAVSGSGTTSALLRDVPVGVCEVTTVIDGLSQSARVSVSAPTGFTCALDGGALACR